MHTKAKLASMGGTCSPCSKDVLSLGRHEIGVMLLIHIFGLMEMLQQRHHIA